MKQILILSLAFVCTAVAGSRTATAIFIDGSGHYSLRGETRTNPAFARNLGTYQAIEQDFRLEGEARMNDRSSFFLELQLFDNPREAYLGDKAQPRECTPRRGTDDTSCKDRHQNTAEPGYEPYNLKATRAYMRYGFDYCLIEAGRRGRDWGLGIFMDSGNDPFDTDATVYDGVTCRINVQKTQILGFSFGYDKLSETGNYIDNPYDRPYATLDDATFDQRDRNFGPNDSDDDIDQYFFTIEFDDRKANAGSPFTKQIGVYFANISAASIEDGGNRGGANTDLKFLDLYTGFFFTDLAIRNEILFRLGKSADPNWHAMGGKIESGGDPATNKLDAIGIAGNIEWTLSRSGAALGPAEYNSGDASRHVMFFEYMYAPGDSDGYLNEGSDSPLSDEERDDKVSAIAFHRNYKPGLILFNGRPETEALRVDGVFHPSRVLNATAFSLGYRYESLDGGNFEVKLLTGRLNKTMPTSVKDDWEARVDLPGGDEIYVPAGYYGNDLGYELDLEYKRSFGREIDIGAAIGAAVPGKAWRVQKSSKNVPNFALQTYAAFKF